MYSSPLQYTPFPMFCLYKKNAASTEKYLLIWIPKWYFQPCLGNSAGLQNTSPNYLHDIRAELDFSLDNIGHGHQGQHIVILNVCWHSGWVVMPVVHTVYTGMHQATPLICAESALTACSKPKQLRCHQQLLVTICVQELRGWTPNHAISQKKRERMLKVGMPVFAFYNKIHWTTKYLIYFIIQNQCKVKKNTHTFILRYFCFYLTSEYKYLCML